MAPAITGPDRPGFLIYYEYEEGSAGADARPAATTARRTATVVAVLALVTLLSLTLGPAFRFS